MRNGRRRRPCRSSPRAGSGSREALVHELARFGVVAVEEARHGRPVEAVASSRRPRRRRPVRELSRLQSGEPSARARPRGRGSVRRSPSGRRSVRRTPRRRSRRAGGAGSSGYVVLDARGRRSPQVGGTPEQWQWTASMRSSRITCGASSERDRSKRMPSSTGYGPWSHSCATTAPTGGVRRRQTSQPSGSHDGAPTTEVGFHPIHHGHGTRGEGRGRSIGGQIVIAQASAGALHRGSLRAALSDRARGSRSRAGARSPAACCARSARRTASSTSLPRRERVPRHAEALPFCAAFPSAGAAGLPGGHGCAQRYPAIPFPVDRGASPAATAVAIAREVVAIRGRRACRRVTAACATTRVVIGLTTATELSPSRASIGNSGDAPEDLPADWGRLRRLDRVAERGNSACRASRRTTTPTAASSRSSRSCSTVSTCATASASPALSQDGPRALTVATDAGGCTPTRRRDRSADRRSARPPPQAARSNGAATASGGGGRDVDGALSDARPTAFRLRGLTRRGGDAGLQGPPASASSTTADNEGPSVACARSSTTACVCTRCGGGRPLLALPARGRAEILGLVPQDVRY